MKHCAKEKRDDHEEERRALERSAGRSELADRVRAQQLGARRRTGVVAPEETRAALQLVVARQVRPAVGPVDVDGHVRRTAGGQRRAADGHARRHDVERVGQRRRHETGHGRDEAVRPPVPDGVRVDDVADRRGQQDAQHLARQARRQAAEEARQAALVVDLARRRH